jgi:hypothetical protein
VVGPTPLRRMLWVAGATLAAATITALALHGQRPDGDLVRFEPSGLMLSIAPDTVTEIVISRGERRWRFERAGARAWATASGSSLPERVTSHLNSGLRFLHVSTPQRVLEGDEVAGIGLSEFGLAPPRYVVTARAAGVAPFEIEFGASSPQGSAQYARVTGRPGIVLLPSFVGAQWESVMDAP